MVGRRIFSGIAFGKELLVLEYPLELSFKIATIGARVRVTDARGRQVAYVRKKKFRLREDVQVFTGENRRNLLFRIRADRA